MIEYFKSTSLDLIPNSKFYEERERDVGALWNILIKKTFS